MFILALSFACGAVLIGCNRDANPREGQQPVIVFRGTDGRTLTLEELQGSNGQVRWEVVGGANVPAEAKRLHEQAREAGGRAQYAQAIGLLTKAAELAPEWPYPIYDRAYTHLLMKDVDAARADYQTTVHLAPRGFFTAITALDTLAREQKGDLPPGIYTAYVSLEWMNDRATKLQVVRQLIERAPRFAPAWKELALLTDEDAERLRAIEKGLAAQPDAETKGILIINKALVLDQNGEREAAVRLLGELAVDPTSTLASEHLARATLASLLRR